MTITSLDIGYAWTKAKYRDNIFIQPSVLGDKKPLHEENKKEGYIIHENYFLGELALRHSDIKYYSLSDSKADNWTTEILIKASLAYLQSDGSHIVTGLPIDFYFNQREQFSELIKSLNGINTSIEIIGSSRLEQSIQTLHHKIVPQPLGAAMNHLLNEYGELVHREDAKGRILVVDWGRYTLDLLILDSMEIHKASCSPQNLGIEVFYNILRRYIREKLDKTPSIYEMDSIVKNEIYEGYNISELIESSFKAVSSQILMEIESFNMKFDRVLIVGGQAERLSKHLPLENVIVGDQLSNLMGYEKIGKRQWKEE